MSPSWLATRARVIRSSAPLLSSPLPGRLAQLGERRLDKAEVTGSSPVSPMVKAPLRRGFRVPCPNLQVPIFRRGGLGWAQATYRQGLG